MAIDRDLQALQERRDDLQRKLNAREAVASGVAIEVRRWAKSMRDARA